MRTSRAQSGTCSVRGHLGKFSGFRNSPTANAKLLKLPKAYPASNPPINLKVLEKMKNPLAIPDDRKQPLFFKQLPLRQRPTKRAKMTILIGITCKDGIVLASDSQATVGGEFALPTSKITKVNFQLNEALIACAGDIHLANRVTEMIQDSALRSELNSPRHLADMAEAEIRKFRDMMVDDAQKQSLEEGGFILMLAHFGCFDPSLYLTNILGIASKPESYYAAAGSGSVLAECFFAEFLDRPSTLPESVAAAIYIIDKVKRYDPSCGGQTKVKVIGREKNPYPAHDNPMTRYIGKVYDYPQSDIDTFEREIAEIETSEKPGRIKRLSGVLSEIGKVRWEAYLKSVKATISTNEQTEH